MTDDEMDRKAEEDYTRRMEQFALIAYVTPRPKRRKNRDDYITKNCEECWGAPAVNDLGRHAD